MAEVLFKEESYKVVGSFFEVYSELGSEREINGAGTVAMFC